MQLFAALSLPLGIILFLIGAGGYEEGGWRGLPRSGFLNLFR
jgi:hypothetical protein